MNKSKVDQFLINNQECFAQEDWAMLRMRLEAADESKWPMLSTLRIKDPQTVLMLSIFGGPIGVDRFYLDQPALGWIKTLTCGGLLIWALVDVFFVKHNAYKYNKKQVLDLLNR